jgi:hypothetical protein
MFAALTRHVKESLSHKTNFLQQKPLLKATLSAFISPAATYKSGRVQD